MVKEWSKEPQDQGQGARAGQGGGSERGHKTGQIEWSKTWGGRRSWVHWTVYVGSVSLWFFFLLCYHSLAPGWMGPRDAVDNVYGIIRILGSTSTYWLGQVLHPTP